MAQPKFASPWCRLRVIPCLRAASIGPATTRRQATRRPWSPGRLNCHGWVASGPLQRLATSRRPGRRTRLQPQVHEDLLDHRRLQDRRDDPQIATAVRAVLQVKVEHPLEQLGPPSSAAPLGGAHSSPRTRQALLVGLASRALAAPPAAPPSRAAWRWVPARHGSRYRAGGWRIAEGMDRCRHRLPRDDHVVVSASGRVRRQTCRAVVP
jgi:hypothetical protein